MPKSRSEWPLYRSAELQGLLVTVRSVFDFRFWFSSRNFSSGGGGGAKSIVMHTASCIPCGRKPGFCFVFVYYVIMETVRFQDFSTISRLQLFRITRIRCNLYVDVFYEFIIYLRSDRIESTRCSCAQNVINIHLAYKKRFIT